MSFINIGIQGEYSSTMYMWYCKLSTPGMCD